MELRVIRNGTWTAPVADVKPHVVALIVLSFFGCEVDSAARVSVSAAIGLTPNEVTLPAGEPAQFIVSFTSSSPAPWHLAFAGAPVGVTAVFDPPDVGDGQRCVGGEFFAKSE